MCEAGDHWACIMLASNTVKGAGVDRDIAKAIELFEKACDTNKDATVCEISRVNIEQLEEMER